MKEKDKTPRKFDTEAGWTIGKTKKKPGKPIPKLEKIKRPRKLILRLRGRLGRLKHPEKKTDTETGRK